MQQPASVKIGLQTCGSEGDTRPFLALAGGLRAWGHEVSLVVTSMDGKDYTPYGREMDFPITHVGAILRDDKTIRRLTKKIFDSRSPIRQLKTIKEFFSDAVSEMFVASEQLCNTHDLVIGHSIHHPLRAAAEKTGKPYATVTLNHMSIFSRHSTLLGVPNIGTWANPFWWKLLNFLIDRAVGPEVNKLREREHLAPVKNINDTVCTSKQLNLVAVSAALCRQQPDWPDYHKVCGFFHLPQDTEKWIMPVYLKKFLESGPAPVFITLGSMLTLDPSPRDITETLVHGALLAGCRAIVQSRWNEFPGFPDHPNIFKIQKVPHRYVFPHCSAVIHHGGAGTTHSATLYGCPSVVIEHLFDQFFTAHELKRLGVAPKPLHRRNVTAKKLAHAIRTVLDSPDMKKKAVELGAFMKKENGVKKAVESIENRFAFIRGKS